MPPTTRIQAPKLADAPLSAHFMLSEFLDSQKATREGIANIPDAASLRNLRRVAQALEQVRLLLGGLPVVISSGYRSPELNAAVGGSRSSAHMRGLAVDFTCGAYGTPLQICKLLVAANFPFDQLIYEGTWVHLALPAEGDSPARDVRTAVFRAGQRTEYTKGLPQ